MVAVLGPVGGAVPQMIAKEEWRPGWGLWPRLGEALGLIRKKIHEVDDKNNFWRLLEWMNTRINDIT